MKLRSFSIRTFTFLSLFAGLAGPARAELFPGYLSGSIGIMEATPGVVHSAGSATYHTYWGGINFGMSIQVYQAILDVATSSAIEDRSRLVYGEYADYVRSTGIEGDCYRGILEAESFDEQFMSRGSSQICIEPPEDPGDSNPDQQGTGDGGRGPDESPILIDLGWPGLELTGLDDPVLFDLDADGVAEGLSWTSLGAADSFLVLDRNGNGAVDDGRELFGGVTLQPSSEDPNGFRALAVFDRSENGGNADGWISAQDAVFNALRLWRDANRDGRSQPWEWRTLPGAGVERISTWYATSDQEDEHGNLLRWIGWAVVGHRMRPAAIDVIFLRE